MGGQEINQGGKNENLGGIAPLPPRWRCAWFEYRSGFDLSRAMIALLPQLSQILEPDRGPFRMSDLALSRWISFLSGAGIGPVCLKRMMPVLTQT